MTAIGSEITVWSCQGRSSWGLGKGSAPEGMEQVAQGSDHNLKLPVFKNLENTAIVGLVDPCEYVPTLDIL